MSPEDIRILKYSPELISEILYNFCMGAKRVDDSGAKFELIYLVLPFVMDEGFRNKLLVSNKRSTFKTAFLSKDSNLKDKLFYINDKVKYSKKVTGDGLIYLNSKCEVKVGEYLDVLGEFERKGKASDIQNEYFKAAYNLGTIFSKEGYVNVFLKAKVTNI